MKCQFGISSYRGDGMADQKVREMEPVETQIVEIMPPDVENLIYVVRNKQVMVDSDLAMLYQVETGALNRAVKRNIARFPEDFRFQLTKDEYENLKCQFGTSNGSGTENGYGGRRTLPYVFTEQGISMLASVLHSEVAINVSIKYRYYACICRNATVYSQQCTFV